MRARTPGRASATATLSVCARPRILPQPTGGVWQRMPARARGGTDCERRKLAAGERRSAARAGRVHGCPAIPPGRGRTAPQEASAALAPAPAVEASKSKP
eukprot:11215135-Alexandrium_andersonii.AAC.1